VKKVNPSEERGRKAVRDVVSCLLSSADKGDTYIEKVCGSRVHSGESEMALVSLIIQQVIPSDLIFHDHRRIIESET